MRRLGTWLLLVSCAGCVGPISDWPHGNSDSDERTSDSPAGQAPIMSGDAGVVGPVVSTPGGTPGGAPGGGSVGGGGTTTPPPAMTPTLDASAPSGSPGGTIGGASPGGGRADAGAASPDSSTSFDAGAPLDAGAPPMDDGGFEGGSSEAGASDAGDGAMPDGTCSLAPEAGMNDRCQAYGCTKSLAELTAAAEAKGACATPDALARVCDGQLARGAVQCAQDNAFSLNLGRSISACMRRAPELGSLPNACLACYADETLCTLSRCFVACIDGRDPACQQCRRQQCAGALSKCTGVPAP